MQIIRAQSREHLDLARQILTEYARSLSFHICFEDFQKELAGLPGDCGPPAGRLLLALSDGQAAGSVALREIEEGVGELKRLYVRPAFRGQKLGRALTEAIISEARQIGYRTIRLDTLDQMKTARALYQSLGFQVIPPYYDDADDEVICLELKLR